MPVNSERSPATNLTDFLYPYPPLQRGTLLKRYKRFFADIQLDSGEIIIAHCPNTGPMTGVCIPGNSVWVSVSNNPNRKLGYTWELIQVCDTKPTWVGVNTALPNRVISQALLQGAIPELAGYQAVCPEVPYGSDRKSRIDFLLTGTGDPAYVEVKNTTWAHGTLVMFPDTVTTRGQKHLQELTALRPTARSVMLYFINRNDCLTFAPGDRADPVYGTLFRRAIAAGVEVLPCRFDVSPQGIRYLGLAALQI